MPVPDTKWQAVEVYDAATGLWKPAAHLKSEETEEVSMPNPVIYRENSIR
jgi:hypothetical protein